MRDTCDFPAAHSMDTTWFAIDQEGNLGIFESRENGPVPAQFSVQDMGYQVLQIAREEVFSGRKPIDLSIVKESSRQSHIDAMQFFSSYAIADATDGGDYTISYFVVLQQIVIRSLST